MQSAAHAHNHTPRRQTKSQPRGPPEPLTFSTVHLRDTGTATNSQAPYANNITNIHMKESYKSQSIPHTPHTHSSSNGHKHTPTKRTHAQGASHSLTIIKQAVTQLNSTHTRAIIIANQVLLPFLTGPYTITQTHAHCKDSVRIIHTPLTVHPSQAAPPHPQASQARGSETPGSQPPHLRPLRSAQLRSTLAGTSTTQLSQSPEAVSQTGRKIPPSSQN